MYGMTEEFDMMALESIQNRYLDGRAVRNCSEETSTLVDKAVLNIIKEAHKKARTLLKDNRDLLDKISNVLLEKETIFGDEFMEIVYEKYPEMRIKKEEEDRIKEQARKEAKMLAESRKNSKKEASILSTEKLEAKDEIAVTKVSTTIVENLEQNKESLNSSNNEKKDLKLSNENEEKSTSNENNRDGK